ncbi:putative U box domain, armadillo-like helical, Zinc finger, RING/FYVE/PHD-type [Dioscorea sansibarensis]
MEKRTRELELNVPSLFRCPISLEVMRSPVSLCTGVTYDRASIQRWLDSGNTTCPATMLPLPSTDLVPNLTLRRLISHWPHPAVDGASRTLDLRTAGRLQDLVAFLSDADRDDFHKNSLASAPSFAPALASLIGSDANDHAIKVLALVLTADFIETRSKRMVIQSLCTDLNRTVSALLETLQRSEPDARIESAMVLEAILSSDQCDVNSKSRLAENSHLIRELIRLIFPSAARSTEAGLACLLSLSSAKRSRVRMVKQGLVPALARAMKHEPLTIPASAAEKALKLMEAASGCAEGRAVMCEGKAEAVAAVAGRMMKAGIEGAKAAITVLWTLCHLHGDRRAVEAAAANGVVTKILVLMQGDREGDTRRMSRDLLRIFKISSKGLFAGYDTNTTHISPF